MTRDRGAPATSTWQSDVGDAAAPGEALLAGLRAGDRAAFEGVFRAHYAPLVTFVAGLVPSAAEAEDVVQEVFLRLWTERERLAVQESLRGYLFRAARNGALNRLRRRRTERDGAGEIARRAGDATPPPDRDVQARDVAAAVRAAVDALPERCREVFVLSREHGLRNGEIAEALGISVNTVETQMGRALRSLRARLAPYLD